MGGGFAGLNAAKVFAGREELRVTLIDRRNHHLFQPLLYQVATAALNPADIAVPIRAQFSDAPNVAVHWGKVVSIDARRRTLRCADGHEFGYDFLILATGATHSYFGRPEWEQHAPGLKTLGVPLDRAGRVVVEPDLSVPGHPEIFVAGDLAHAESGGNSVPALRVPRQEADGHDRQAPPRRGAAGLDLELRLLQARRALDHEPRTERYHALPELRAAILRGSAETRLPGPSRRMLLHEAHQLGGGRPQAAARRHE